MEKKLKVQIIKRFDNTRRYVTYKTQEQYDTLIDRLVKKGFDNHSECHLNYTKVLCVDFEQKIIFEMNITCCAGLASCGEKFFTYEEVIDLI